MGRESKKKTEKKHAIRKGKQRYGEISGQDVDQIISLIQTGETETIEKQSNRVIVHLVSYNDRKYKVVYDKMRKMIVTFLPLDEDVQKYKEILR